MADGSNLILPTDSPSGGLDVAALAVCRAFGLDLPPAALEPLGNAGGFSGARLWRVRTDGQWCLRAWPPDAPSESELDTIHGLMLRAAQSLPFVPRLRTSLADGRTWVRAEGRLWEMASWMAGRADFHEHPSAARLTAAVEALARLHRVWQPVQPRCGPSPAVLRRLQKLEAWEAVPASRLRSAVADSEAEVHLWALRGLEAAARWGRSARRALAEWVAVSLPLQPCLCDVWHDHILFDGDRVTGIVDFGGVRLDNVATDLARLLGSLIGDKSAAIKTPGGMALPEPWAVACDAYATIRELSPQERRLSVLLDWTGVVVGITNWLRWLVLKERQFADRTLALARFRTLILRAESPRFASGQRLEN